MYREGAEGWLREDNHPASEPLCGDTASVGSQRSDEGKNRLNMIRECLKGRDQEPSPLRLSCNGRRKYCKSGSNTLSCATHFLECFCFTLPYVNAMARRLNSGEHHA